MSTSEEDHNYYSQTHRRSQLPDYKIDAGQPASTASDDLPLLPALHYHQSQQYPQRPTISTNFDNHSANANLHAPFGDRPAVDASSDPHEFYRPYRESFRRESGSIYGGLDFGSILSEEGMNSTRTAQRPAAPFSSRVNGYGPSAASRRGTRPEDRSSASPMSEKSTTSNRTGTASAGAPRGRQSSLQALVNKFNQTLDEVPPLPSNPTSRSTSANPSPSSVHASRSFKARASSETLKLRQAMTSKSQAQSRDGPHHTMGVSDKRRHNQSSTQASDRSPRRSRKPPTITSNAFATQSMTDLSPRLPQPQRKPLFGEVIPNGQPDLGYGISGSKIRRGSEGSAIQPEPMFHDDTALGARKVSPSSPTAWYMGVTPSLEGIDFGKPVPAKRPDMHRRSRSDIVNGSFAVPPSSSTLNKTVTVMSPPQEQYSSDSSPTATKRNSQSRIPVSNRRRSVTSESGNSGPSRPSSTLGYHTPGWKTSSKVASYLPTPIETKTPQRNARYSARKSPRHFDHSPIRQGSPRLQAFISEPPPAKSPPLRSSRPRQPVSSATTSASRARAAANAPQTNSRKNSKPLPELGGVDLATRRERIQRAFTTKVKEKEIETERRRMSLLHDVQCQKDPNRDFSGNSESAIVPMTSPALKSSFENLPGREDELFSVKTSEDPTGAHDLAVKVAAKNDVVAFDPAQEDSPTLGTAQFLEPLRYDGSEPSSAQTSGTAESFSEQDLRNSKHLSPGNATDVQKAEHDNRFGTSFNQTSVRQSRPETGFYGSERDDRESIQIMLQDAPAENKRPGPSTGLPGQGAHNPAESKWNAGAWVSSSTDAVGHRRDSPTMQRINENDPYDAAAQNAHESMSTNASSYNQSSWSPESQSTTRTARDSDSYNTINNVLDDYHESTFMDSESIDDFQRRLFAQSPALARQGNWNSQKVTQLYLQNYARERPSHSSAMPPPLDPDSRDTTEGTSSVRSLEPEKQHVSTVERERHKDDEKELAPASERVSSGGLKAPETYSHRASASLSNADDWLNTSPSMLDWMAHQQLDTPVEEKGQKPFAFNQKAPSMAAQTEKGLPILPGIQPSGGLGIDITVQSPHDGHAGAKSMHAHPDIASRRGSPMRPDNIARPESPTLRSSTPASTGKYSSAKSGGSLASHDTPSRKNSEESALRFPRPRAGTESAQPGADGASMSSSIAPAEQKRLNRRKNILKEIVDTESSFGKDMTVVVDIYKGTSNVILDAAEDSKALFGNSAEIVQFSMAFLDSLKQAVKSVYVLPRDKRWKTKRDSSATTGSTTTDDQSLSGIDLSDEEKDRMTSIGTAFENHLTQMEKVYTEYLKNHDAANQKLQQLQKSDKVKIWLKECRAYAHDLTTAWDLDSLLVKPVQRILKYPLLLNELLAVTPENHPDFVAIDTAAREMVGVSVRINEAKKRADLVEQVNNSSLQNNKPKKKETEGRLAFPKAFGRRTEKLKQQVGVSDTVQDKKYDAIADKFGSHFFQLQVVMRDVEMYVMDSQNWVNKFNEFVVGFEAYLDVGQTTNPEIESKWRRFRLSMREIQITALTDHINAVRKNVIDPMTTLLKLHDGPQKLMDKRKKRVMDYAKYKAIKEKGEKPDKKTVDLGEQFMAVNDTLKDELPKLFSLTGKLVEACLQNFVQLHLQWMNVWRAKLRQVIDSHEIPPSFESIVPDFKSDFVYVDAQIVALGLCNGSLVNDHANLINFHISPSTSQFGGSTLNDDSRRPSMNTDDTRSRATSSATIDPNRSRGLSMGNTQIPLIPSPDFGRPSDGFGLDGANNVQYNPSNYAQVQGRRIRASSTASSRTPISPPDTSAGWRGQVGPSMSSNPNRPSTSTGRSYESPPMTRPSYDSGRPSNDRLLPNDAARYGRDGQGSPSHRQSTVFSSAMPMSDSPRPQSPSDEVQSPSDFNILFLAASVYEFNIDRARREAGYPYLTYVAGEVFDPPTP